MVHVVSEHDLANAVASFSSKSIHTVDESNQSVAQEFKTNESIAIQGYTIANMKQNQTGVDKLMNSDEIVVLHQDIIPNPAHQYKKSMMNPAYLKPSLEIKLQEHSDLKPIKSKLKNTTSPVASAFLPVQITPKSKDKEAPKLQQLGVGGMSKQHLVQCESGRDIKAGDASKSRNNDQIQEKKMKMSFNNKTVQSNPVLA